MKKFMAFVCLAFAVTACSGIVGPSMPTNFYVLKTTGDLTPPPEISNLNPEINVGVGPVQIPGYADRAQIVTFGSGSKITVADFDHWAEPLGDGIKRVLSGNVATLIGEKKVFPYPADFRPDEESLQIAVEIVDITQSDDGRAYLSARWHVRRLTDGQILLRNAKEYETPSSAGNYNSYVDALSELLGRMAVDLAASVQQAGK
ncbi:MAG: hypothetical protein COB93_12025 [Sneathiella sp.]|nr:MAG: hypothetical protein COB93_12025 [Sneathiella sp.]